MYSEEKIKEAYAVYNCQVIFNLDIEELIDYKVLSYEEFKEKYLAGEEIIVRGWD